MAQDIGLTTEGTDYKSAPEGDFKQFTIIKKTLIIGILLCSCSSSKYIIEEPAIKNPTSYVFSKPKQEVEKAIVEALGGHESSKRSKFSGYILHKSLNKGNFKLMAIPGNLSKVYFNKKGKAYLYCPVIQFVIDSIAENITKVSINVENPEVLTRLTLSPILTWIYKYKPVLATTVEEYEILLMIGKELGEKNMPELKIPEKIVLRFPNRYKPWHIMQLHKR